MPHETLDTARWDTKLAARCIGAELRAEIELNDDRSAPGMYDLRIVYADRGPAAVEVTAVADQDAIQLAKLVYDSDEPFRVEGLAGGWAAVLHPTAIVKDLRTHLPLLLQVLESQGVSVVLPDEWWLPGPEKEALRSLGVAHLFRIESDSPGSITFSIDQGPDRNGGVVSADGRQMLEWLPAWLARPDKVDNLEKLERSGLEERHLFLIFPSFADAPFTVADMLMRENGPLPNSDPDLPPQVTHAWLMSTWNFSGTGMRWAPDSGLSRFEKVSA